MMKKGFYTGRFQPFHKGHLSAVKQALKDVDFLYIGIGSAQYSHKPDNPFTVSERKKMIRMALVENGISEKKFKIISVPDIHDDDKWPAYVDTLVPPFNIVFVGDNGLVKKLYEKHTDIPVKIVKEEIPIRATDIRKAMKSNRDWKKYLSKSTIKYLDEIDGAKRIRLLQ